MRDWCESQYVFAEMELEVDFDREENVLHLDWEPVVGVYDSTSGN